MATTIEGDAIYIGSTEYVDVPITNITIPSSGYNSVAFTLPTGCLPYAWIWLGGSWDEKVMVSLQHFVIGSTEYNNICFGGPINRNIQNSTIRVFYRKFASAS